jgi:hypothetical protein
MTPFHLALTVAAALYAHGPRDLRARQLRTLLAGLVVAAVGLGVA